ncbi:hypothetical protein T05_10388, partial [Trichinella murrelli]
LIPAIQGNFPNTQVQGCFFHFYQAVLRRIKLSVIKRRKQKVKMLMALAFFPVNLVPRVSKS